MDLDRTYFNSIRLNTHRGKYYDVDAVDRLLVDIRSKADILMKEVISSREQLAEAEKTVDALRDENTDLFLKGQALSQEILSLREELRAAQAGEASLILEEPEETEEESSVAEEPNQEEAPALGEEEFYFLTEELPEPPKSEKTFETDQTESEVIPEETESKPEEREQEALSLLEEAEREASEILENAGAERDRILSSARMEREKTVERMERVFAMLKEISTYTIEKTERIHEEYLQAVAGEEAPEDLSEKVGRIAAQMSELEEDF